MINKFNKLSAIIFTGVYFLFATSCGETGKKIKEQEKELEFYRNQTAVTIGENLIVQIDTKNTTTIQNNTAALSLFNIYRDKLNSIIDINVGTLTQELLKAAFELAKTDPECKKIVEETVEKWPRIRVVK